MRNVSGFPRRAVLPRVFTLIVLALLLWTATSGLAQRVYRISYSPGSEFHLKAKKRIKVLYERAGLAVEFVPMPHKRSMQSASDGLVDGEVGRIKGVDKRFPGLRRVKVPLIRLTGGAYVLRESPVRQYSTDLLDTLRPGAIHGIQWMVKELNGRPADTVSDYRKLLGMLAEKRVEIVLGSTLSVEAVCSSEGMRDVPIRRLEPLVYDQPLFHYVNERNAALIPLLEETLRLLRKEHGWGNELPASP